MCGLLAGPRGFVALPREGARSPFKKPSLPTHPLHPVSQRADHSCQRGESAEKFAARLYDLRSLGRSCDGNLNTGRTTAARLAAHVELENAGHRDHGLRAVTVLEHREFHCFGAAHKQPAAKTVLILDNPLAEPVLADP